MDILTVTFRGMDPSAAIETLVRERAKRLERYRDQLVACRVVVESPHRHHHQGRLFHIRIDVTTAGGELVVNRDHGDDPTHEDAYAAVRDAFEALERRLKDYTDKRRGYVKSHDGTPAVARITRLNAEEGYGFLATPDGREVYFHENAVKGGSLKGLSVGTPVQFVESEGTDGPQATVVVPIEGHSLRR
jgi:ribosomal subunit interface protein